MSQKAGGTGISSPEDRSGTSSSRPRLPRACPTLPTTGDPPPSGRRGGQRYTRSRLQPRQTCSPIPTSRGRNISLRAEPLVSTAWRILSLGSSTSRSLLEYVPRMAGSRRGQSRPTPSMLAIREHTRGAVLRCGQDVDGGRSGALFCARAGVVGGSHGTGCPVQLCVLCGQRRGPSVLAPVACAPTMHEWGTQQAGTLGKRRAPSRRRGLFESRSTGNAA